MSAAFRSGRMSDLDALVAIEDAAFVGDRISRRAFRHLLVSRSCALLVAEDDAPILGYAVVLFRKGLAGARLYSIAVDPARRRPGLGRALLRAAEETAAGRGATEMRLEVREDNARAIALYEDAGFQRFGMKRDYYADGAAALRYAKPLDGRRAQG